MQLGFRVWILQEGGAGDVLGDGMRVCCGSFGIKGTTKPTNKHVLRTVCSSSSETFRPRATGKNNCEGERQKVKNSITRKPSVQYLRWSNVNMPLKDGVRLVDSTLTIQL